MNEGRRGLSSVGERMNKGRRGLSSAGERMNKGQRLSVRCT